MDQAIDKAGLDGFQICPRDGNIIHSDDPNAVVTALNEIPIVTCSKECATWLETSW